MNKHSSAFATGTLVSIGKRIIWGCLVLALVAPAQCRAQPVRRDVPPPSVDSPLPCEAASSTVYYSMVPAVETRGPLSAFFTSYVSLSCTEAAIDDSSPNLDSAEAQTMFSRMARFAGTTSAGHADGASWEDRWAYTSIPWNAVEELAQSNPVYVFLDGGSSTRVYTSTMTISASGSSDSNRIYIMPGYAAQQMGVPGDHGGHMGQVIFDLGGADTIAVAIWAERYVTIDGYSDPRPSAGNTPKFTIRDVNGDAAAMIGSSGSRWITVRNVEVYQERNTNAGDGIIFTYNTPVIDGHILIEYCYIHNGGYYNPTTGAAYAGVWISGYDNTVVRYCEIRNWGFGASDSGEGIGFWHGRQNGAQVYGNLFVAVGTGVRSAAKVRFNTFYDCGYPIDVNDTLGESVYVENNLFYDWDHNSIVILGSDGVYINANIFHHASAGANAHIHGTWYEDIGDLDGTSDTRVLVQSSNIEDDGRLLINPPSECGLSSNASSAVDAAFTSNWSVDRDFLGRSRIGLAWDIGAFEAYGALFLPIIDLGDAERP